MSENLAIEEHETGIDKMGVALLKKIGSLMNETRTYRIGLHFINGINANTISTLNS